MEGSHSGTGISTDHGKILEMVRTLLAVVPEGWTSADPGPGPWTRFRLNDFKSKMQRSPHTFKGIAWNFFSWDLTTLAVQNNPVAWVEIMQYKKEKFNVEEALSRKCFEWECPVVGVVHDLTPEKVLPGTWRKISMDKQLYAFASLLIDWLSMTEENPDFHKKDAVLELLKAASLHCPCEFRYLPVGPDVQHRLFALAWDLQEDFRKKNEKFAPSGWQAACYFKRVQQLNEVAHGDDSASSVVEFVEQHVKLAATSEYGMAKTQMDAALRMHERFVEAGCVAQNFLLKGKSSTSGGVIHRVLCGG